MKKQILTLTMCLALTVTSALASTPATKHAPAKKPVAAEKKVVPVAEKKASCATTALATPALTPAEEARKKFEARMAKEREDFYTALSLTTEQRTKAEALDLKNRTEVEPLIVKVHEEKAKLRELKAKKACPCEILKQKHELKVVRHEVKAHFVAADKEFRAILTQDQVTKLDNLVKERKAEMKKNHPCNCPFCKHHRHHSKHEFQKAQAAGTCPCACHKIHLFGEHKCPLCLIKDGKKPCDCQKHCACKKHCECKKPCACPQCQKQEAAPAPAPAPAPCPCEDKK